MKRSTVVRARFQLLGVLFLAVCVLFVAVTIGFYNKSFTRTVPVRLQTDHVGNQLKSGADVKVRGVIVGEVRSVRGVGEHAELDLAMRPDKVDRIPNNVSAMLLPKTLFGERYVSLQVPEQKSGETLAAGDVIGQDRSGAAMELQEVLDHLMPTLQALQPEKVSSTLGSIAQALEGRGEQLGQTARNVDAYLRELNPSLPDVKADIEHLGKVADTYDRAAPDIANALSNLTTTSRTAVDKSDGLRQLSTSLTNTSVDARSFLEVNQDNLIHLAANSRPTVELLGKYSPEYPCIMRQMVEQLPVGARTFGEGKEHPNMARLTIEFTRSRGKYEPGKDEPSYDDKRGPRCYQKATPDNTFPQYPPDGPIKDGSTKPPPPLSDLGKDVPYSTGDEPYPEGFSGQTAAPPPSGASGAGRPGEPGGDVPVAANSPEERRLISMLSAPQMGVMPDDVPNWGSVLVGPVYRGTEVSLR